MPGASTAITIQVEGSKWKWRYEYPANADGHVHKLGGAFTKQTQDENGKVIEEGTMGKSALYVPVDTNIILEMTAPLGDVLHAWYVPAFRMKEDVVPGRITKQWFNAGTVGEYDIECAEYCGTRHSYMYSKIHVMPVAEYEAWYNSADSVPGANDANNARSGEDVFTENGCNGCHAYDTDGSWTDSLPDPDMSGLTPPEAEGAHQKHIDHRVNVSGSTLSATADTFGSGVAAAVCGTCHTNDSGQHQNGARQIWLSGTNPFAPGTPVYNGVPGTSGSVNPKSCSNINCHFGDSPEWAPYTP